MTDLSDRAGLARQADNSPKALSLPVLLSAALVFAEAAFAPSSAASDFSLPEPGEALSGGAATSTRTPDRNAFSHSSANLAFEKRLDFRVGDGVFRKLWVSSPASTKSSDGLGPLYNARACQRCHVRDGRGHPPSGPEDGAVSLLLRLSIPPRDEAEQVALESGRLGAVPDPVYGGQLQDFAIQGHDAEGRIAIAYEEIPVTLADGTQVSLRKPHYRVEKTAFGPLHSEVRISPRVASPMIGLGLLELVPEARILAAADPDDRDGDGISGRPNRVWSEERGLVMLGRFGWKAGQPTVRQQVAAAFSGDMGLGTSLFPDGAGDCTEAQTDCRAAPNGNGPRPDNLEVSDRLLDLVTFYSRHLAVPARRDVGAPQVLDGKRLFHEAGCAVCHSPVMVTGDSERNPELAHQTIRPYSDLLLHDMGEGLADHSPEAAADGREWRTPPLWGIGLTALVSGHSRFLHDGRARNLLEAVLWHGGEAQAARDAVVAMETEERAALLRFLESL